MVDPATVNQQKISVVEVTKAGAAGGVSVSPQEYQPQYHTIKSIKKEAQINKTMPVRTITTSSLRSGMVKGGANQNSAQAMATTTTRSRVIKTSGPTIVKEVRTYKVHKI